MQFFSSRIEAACYVTAFSALYKSGCSSILLNNIIFCYLYLQNLCSLNYFASVGTAKACLFSHIVCLYYTTYVAYSQSLFRKETRQKIEDSDSLKNFNQLILVGLRVVRFNHH